LRNRVNPSRNSVPEFKPRGRGNSSFFFLFSCWVLLLMSGLGERFKNRIPAIQKSVSPTSHTCSRRFFFYTTRLARAQGDVQNFAVQPRYRTSTEQPALQHIVALTVGLTPTFFPRLRRGLPALFRQRHHFLRLRRATRHRAGRQRRAALI
jgi:hypothetical protein